MLRRPLLLLCLSDKKFQKSFKKYVGQQWVNPTFFYVTIFFGIFWFDTFDDK